MEEDSKTLLTLKRLSVALPLLALPFVPAMGKIVAGLVVFLSLQHIALQ